MKARQLLMGISVLILMMSIVSLIALAQLQGPLTSPLISNGVACIQFNNPPPYPGNTYPVHWDVFSVALNGGNPCNYPNLFIGDLRAGETVHLFYNDGYSGAGDGDSQIGSYTQLYVINNSTILGVINASNGLREVTYYELVGNLPVVYVNFTVSNLPQPTMVWYGIDFINDIYVDANPGETTWVVALGVGNYSFPAQDPNEMYNLAINWGFKATLTPDQFTPGSFAIIYIPPSAGQFIWMEINQPGVGTYYLALYPLMPIDGYYVQSANGWAFNKAIGLIFSNNTTSANGALLVVYGNSLSNLEQNINEALSTLGVSTKPSTHTSTQSVKCAINPNFISYLDNSSASAFLYINFTCAELELFMGGGPMFGNLSTPGTYIANDQSYFNHVVSGPYIISTTINGWRVWGVTYLAVPTYGNGTVVNSTYTLQKTFIVASNGGEFITLLLYRDLAPVSLDLNQYWSHIHKGVDGLSFGIWPPGYSPYSTFNPMWSQEALNIHGNTTLYINGQYQGPLTSFGLWQVLPTGPITLVNSLNNWTIYIVPMDDMSTTPQIQLVTNGFSINGTIIDNSIMNIQHAEIVLAPGQYAQYVYSIGINTQPPSQAQIQQILPQLINLAITTINVTAMRTLLNLSILINGTLVKNQSFYVNVNSSTTYIKLHSYASYSTTLNPVTLNVTVVINNTASQSIVTSLTFTPPITGVGRNLYFTIPLSIRLLNGEVKTIYVNVTLFLFINYVTTGSIVVNVYNVNGEPASTVPGVVYGLLVNTTSASIVARAYMNNNSQLIFNNVPAGTYTLYIYHYPNLGLNETEYWGSLTVSSVPGKTNMYNLIRNMPWIEKVQSTYVGNNEYRITITVINPQSTQISGRVSLYISPDKSSTDAAQFVNLVTYKPGTNEFTFTYTPKAAGTYYAYVVIDAYVNQYWGEPIPTDQYNWVQIIQVAPPSPTTTSFILVGDANIQNNELILTNNQQYTNGAVFWQSYFDNNKILNIEITGNVSFLSTEATPGDGFVFYLFLNPSNWGIGPQYNYNVPSYSISGISPVMGDVFFPQSSTPYIVVQWDPVWQNAYRQVGVVGQWNVWIIGPNGQVIKAWNGIGVGSINLTTLKSSKLSIKQLYIEISYDSSRNILTGIVYAGYQTKSSAGLMLSFFVLDLSNYFIPPKSNSYIFGIGSATGLHYGEWYLISESYYNAADDYVFYVQGSSNSVLSILESFITSILRDVGLPNINTATLLNVDFSDITHYIVRIFINNYNYGNVIYVPIPNMLTINLTSILWPQMAYDDGNGFEFSAELYSPIYIVFIPQGNEYSVVSSWNPFLDMYSYANYDTNYSPGGNCYGFSSTAILYFDRYVLGEDTINGLVVPYYPLQNYGPTNTPTATAQLYLGQVVFVKVSNGYAADLVVSPPQYPLTPAALEIAIHQIFDPNSNAWNILSKQANDFNDLETYLDEDLPVMLALWQTNPFGAKHAVVAWGYAKLANGSYAILISDPNYPGTIRVAIYTPNAFGPFSSFTYTWSDGTTFNYFHVIQPTPAEWSWFSNWLNDLLHFFDKIKYVEKELTPYTLIVVHASSSSNVKVFLKDNPSMYDTFTQWGDSQSFVGLIPGSTGVFDGDVEVFAIPNQYDGDLEVDPIGTSVGVFIMQVANSSIKGFIVNATSNKPISVTIGLRFYGLYVLSNSSADLNVTGFYMNKTGVVVNSTTTELEPGKAFVVNSTELIGIQWASAASFSVTPSVVSSSNGTSSTTRSSNTGFVINVALPIIIIALAVITALFIIYIGLLRRR